MRNELISLVEKKGAADTSVVFLTGDLGFSVIESIQQTLGERYINAGVAEANMTSMAGGLAEAGFLPFLYSIAPFVTMRCFEQIRNDFCLYGRSGRIIGVGSGYAYGQMGPSHHALEDAHIIAALPNTAVVAPGCFGELHAMFAAMDDFKGVVYFRLDKDKGPNVPNVPALTQASPAWIAHPGTQINLIVAGTLLGHGLDAARLAQEHHQISVNVISVPLVHPFPQAVVAGLLNDGPVITAWDAYDGNPLETGVMRMLLDQTLDIAPRKFQAFSALRNAPKLVGSQARLLARSNLDGPSLAKSIAKILSL